MHSRLGRTLVVSTLARLPAAAQAGSPLICFPMAIGEARSLAWGSGRGWNTPSPDYERSRLAEDTLHLRACRPVLVRGDLRRGDLRIHGRRRGRPLRRCGRASRRPGTLARRAVRPRRAQTGRRPGP
jgi:hypothetical protein